MLMLLVGYGLIWQRKKKKNLGFSRSDGKNPNVSAKLEKSQKTVYLVYIQYLADFFPPVLVVGGSRDSTTESSYRQVTT